MQEKIYDVPAEWAKRAHIDAVPGRGAGFSLEAPLGVRFLTRSRVFTDAEAADLERTDPAMRGAEPIFDPSCRSDAK